jgi:hypothetical protein
VRRRCSRIQEQPTGGLRPDARKNGQISASAAVWGASITAVVRAAMRSCQNVAKAQKSTPIWGCIWRIPIKPRYLAVAFAMMLAAVLPFSAQAATMPPITVHVRPGVTVKYLAVEPTKKAKPAAAVVLFAGGGGLLKLQPDGTIATGLRENFLVRSRSIFAQKGLFVAVVDTPNQVPISGNLRLSAQYAADMGVVIKNVRSHLAAGGKVWLVGTSSGTISAASVTAHLPQRNSTPPTADQARLRQPDGVVLTSTQTRLVAGLCGRTVFNANLAAIDVPALIVSHRSDTCKCSPPSYADKLMNVLKHAPSKQVILLSGGRPPQGKDSCQGLTPHGFFGVEDAAVDAVANWIASH